VGPSLGVNKMWIKRNDHAPKSECVDYSNICPKKAVLEKIKIKFDHSLVSSWLHLLFPASRRRSSLKNYYNNISLPWALAFSLRKHLFCLSHCKTRWTMSVNNVGFEKMSIGDLKTYSHYDSCSLV
jgi:hypothetical protein